MTEQVPSNNSSVLLIKHPKPESVSFGSDFINTTSTLVTALTTGRYSVIVYPLKDSSLEELKILQTYLTTHSKATKIILVTENSNISIRQALYYIYPFKILNSYFDKNFELYVHEAFEAQSLELQNQQLVSIVQNLNEQLIKLSKDLEEKINKRQKSLVASREKLIKANKLMESLQRALVAVHRASSIGEMERLINDALKESLYLVWTRIALKGLSPIDQILEKEKATYNIFSVPMRNEQEETGHVYYAKKNDISFTADDKNFLTQLTQAISLAVNRLNELRKTEDIKQQWESTFNSITIPISLIDEDYNLTMMNEAYKAKSAERGSFGKCYKVLFNRDEPCTNCVLGSNFELITQNDTKIEVTSHAIKLDKKSIFVQLYRDVTAERKLERQVVESAKMAELGTIGSSIAHELNNPIGGILTFAQLIKMDLKSDEPLYEDIHSIQLATERCRDIIQNLLGFTHHSPTSQPTHNNLENLLQRACEIIELQSKAYGIFVRLKKNDVKIESPTNDEHFIQAFIKLTQVLVEFIRENQSIDALGTHTILTSYKKLNSTEVEVTLHTELPNKKIDALVEKLNAHKIEKSTYNMDIFSDPQNSICIKLILN